MTVSIRWYKYDESSVNVAYSVKPAVGDSLYVFSWYGTGTSVTGWTLSAGNDTTYPDQKLKLWTRTADGSVTDQGYGIQGYRLGLVINGPSSIDGSVTFYSSYVSGGVGTGTTCTIPAPNGGNDPTSTNALMVQMFEVGSYGYYDVPSDTGADWPVDLTNPVMAKTLANYFNYPDLQYVNFYDDFGSAWWARILRGLFTKKIYTTTNPGAQTYTLIPAFGNSTFQSDNGATLFAASFFIQATGPVKYGPSIRR